MNRRLRDPGVKFFPLVAGSAHIEAAQQQQRKPELGDRGDERQAANPDVVVIAQQQQRERARDGQKRQDREQKRLLHVSSPSRAAGK